MKNVIVFGIVAILFFFASCSKETISLPEPGVEKTILNRTSTTAIQVTVVSSENSAGVLNVEISGVPSGVVPTDDQDLVFDNAGSPVSLALSVIDFSIVGGNVSINFDTDGVDLIGLDIQGTQFIIIEDNMVE